VQAVIAVIGVIHAIPAFGQPFNQVGRGIAVIFYQ
jgi:hypothetical protein